MRDGLPLAPGEPAGLSRALDAEGIAWTAGRMATIDAIVLEDDTMVAALADAGCAALGMETACRYAVSVRLGLAASSVHLVSDSPFLGDTNPTGLHLGAYPRGLAVAARPLLDS